MALAYGGGLFGDACWARLPEDLCVQNLKLFPCQATVGMLEDCVWTSVGKFRGRGCGPFLLAPGCEHTVLQQDYDLSLPCAVPVQ